MRLRANVIDITCQDAGQRGSQLIAGSQNPRCRHPIGHEGRRGVGALDVFLQEVGLIQGLPPPKSDAMSAAASDRLAQPTALLGQGLPGESSDGKGNPCLPAEGAQRRPMAHLPQGLEVVAQQDVPLGQLLHHVGMILQVGDVDHGLEIELVAGLKQGLSAEARAKISHQRIVLHQLPLVAVAEIIQGEDVIASPDGGLGDGPGAEAQDQNPHWDANGSDLRQFLGEFEGICIIEERPLGFHRRFQHSSLYLVP